MHLLMRRNCLIKQYYEANLALKGAEDGIIVDSEALFVN